ncbi:unnamed protein product [Ectocarpus sp. 12 AP-2014]
MMIYIEATLPPFRQDGLAAMPAHGEAPSGGGVMVRGAGGGGGGARQLVAQRTSHGRERGPPHVCGCRRPREASGTSGRGGSMARRATPPSHGRPQSARFLQ